MSHLHNLQDDDDHCLHAISVLVSLIDLRWSFPYSDGGHTFVSLNGDIAMHGSKYHSSPIPSLMLGFGWFPGCAPT